MATFLSSPFVPRITAPGVHLKLHSRQTFKCLTKKAIPLSIRASLNTSPGALERFEEETENELLIALSERVQAPVNPQVYQDGFLMSKLKPRWVYESHPGFDTIQVRYDAPTGAYPINLTSNILDFYLKKLLPLVPVQRDFPLDDETIDLDVRALRKLSMSVHLGISLAEMKYQRSPDSFNQPIFDQDRVKLAKLLKSDEDFKELKKRLSMKEELLKTYIYESFEKHVFDDEELYAELLTLRKALGINFADLFMVYLFPLRQKAGVEHLLSKKL